MDRGVNPTRGPSRPRVLGVSSGLVGERILPNAEDRSCAASAAADGLAGKWAASPHAARDQPALRLVERALPEKSGGLNGSAQHLLGVYRRASRIPTFLADVGSSAERSCRGL